MSQTCSQCGLSLPLPLAGEGRGEGGSRGSAGLAPAKESDGALHAQACDHMFAGEAGARARSPASLALGPLSRGTGEGHSVDNPQ